ncbi:MULTISPECIES: hypothetical protein [Methylobacterium]|jgi:hypothetical protein|uniref:hypothetical protein n=1 Tax=Methylobacterium TaxID=407 RepID=UPI0008EEF9B5|nr:MULTISPECIES: hypothetical protein [Methylobacterium]MDH3027578.1 hypothetical protein [Methylobacterium fujisawaense]WFS07806.1 hypothetical protein P9K36_00415 [Methylobacterium sp. 391_Methyba4]SFU55508.1 hypothetical protein SAMN02799643_01137 [Methylobacterium sp. UNCCL125]
MTNGAEAIISAVAALKELLKINGLSDKFYIEFDDNLSGRSLHSFIVNGLGIASDPSVWPQGAPEYKFLCRDQIDVLGARIRWPIQSTPGG